MVPSDQDNISFPYKKAIHIPTSHHVALSRPFHNKETCKLLLVWYTEPTLRALCLLGKCLTTELHPSPGILVY